MTTPAGRLGPRSWGILAVLVLVVLGAWLLSGANGGKAGPTPAAPAASAQAGPAIEDVGQEPDAQTTRATPGQQSVDPVLRLPWIAVADLPREARRTLELIDEGGPFPYAKDGSTFENFEGILPRQGRGFYKEYTVDTPGSRDRGARRIVTGDDDRIQYWTDDHYETFTRIRR